jgi:hypothetical protein
LLILNPVPLIVALERTKFEPPVFFSCMTCVFFVPTATAPKLALVADTESVGGVVADNAPGANANVSVNAAKAARVRQ